MATVGPTGEVKSWIVSGTVFVVHDVGKSTTTGGETGGEGAGNSRSKWKGGGGDSNY